MSIVGTFDPSLEARPAKGFPSSINQLANSSSELGLPSGAAVYLFDNPATSSASVAWSASSDPAHTGERAIKLTYSSLGFPPQLIPTEVGVKIPVTVADYPSGMFLSAWVYPVGSAFGARLAPKRTTDAQKTGSGFAFQTCLADTWTRVTGWVSAIQLSTLAVGGVTEVVIYGLVGAASGAAVYVDDVMPVNQASGAGTPDWEPADGEPFYVNGDSWLVTGLDTFEGLSLSPGDLITAGTLLDYALVGDVDWVQTDVLADIGSAVVQPPIGIVGVPLGVGDWRFALQILLPEDAASRWGVARWGQSIWSGLAWFDITSFLRGASWSRGATSVGSRPEVGTCDLTLENRNLQFSPWNGISSYRNSTVVDTEGVVQPGFFGPGTVLRLVGYSPTGQVEPFFDPTELDTASDDRWVSMFTGIVSSWGDVSVEKGADGFVEVSLNETFSTLARADAPALGSPVGNDDLPGARVDRLLQAAGWSFGPVVDELDYVTGSSADYLLQSTVMAQPRISELYLTADSVGGVLRSDRLGRAVLYNVYPNRLPVGITRGPDRNRIAGIGPLVFEDVDDYFPAYVADSVKSANDDEVIVNVVNYARVGGSVRSARDEQSVSRYEAEIVAQRSDLIGKSDVLVDRIIADIIDSRSRLALRLSELGVHSRHEGSCSLLLSLDVDEVIDVVLPPLLEGYTAIVSGASVLGMSHDLTPAGPNGLVWTATYSFGLQGPLTLTED